MKSYKVYQLYTSQDIYKHIFAETKEKAIEIAMSRGNPDEQQTEDTETWAEEIDNVK